MYVPIWNTLPLEAFSIGTFGSVGKVDKARYCVEFFRLTLGLILKVISCV